MSLRTLASIAKRALPREYPRQPAGQSIPFPAPSLGMNTRDSVSALDPREARVIRNMIPESGKLIIRKGKTTHQTISGASAVGAMWTHEGTSADVLLAAANGKIFDVTGAPSQLATGFSLNTWSIEQFNDTSIAVNGTDTPWAYTVAGGFDATSGFSGSGLTIANLRTVKVVGVRLWFTEEGSADVWYGAVSAITGVLTKFQLSQETKGGYCVGIYEFGPYTVFVMSSGEVLTYQGDPGVDFSLAKRYRAPKPVGYDPGIDVAGDLVLMTASAPLPFEAIAAGIAFDTTSLKSWGKIAPSWAMDFENYGSLPGWNGKFFKGLVIFNIPTSATTSKQWVFNTRTRAWSYFDGLAASQFAELGGTLYFGDVAQGKVLSNTSGTDQGGIITGLVRGAFAYPFGDKVNGQYTLAQLNCTASGLITAQLQVDVDFKETGITAPEVPVSSTGSGPWDGPWDGPWGNDGEALLRWSKIKGHGRAVAPVVQFNSQADDLEFFATNILAAPAGVL
jgi:hypothetical protein